MLSTELYEKLEVGYNCHHSRSDMPLSVSTDITLKEAKGFRFQVPAQPLVPEATRLIEKETS
jgi:hypothetical protein